MQCCISVASAAGFQELRKTACRVNGLFIAARVRVPLVMPFVNRSARVNCGICTGCAASQVKFFAYDMWALWSVESRFLPSQQLGKTTDASRSAVEPHWGGSACL